MRLGPWREDEPTSVPDGRDIESYYLAVPEAVRFLWCWESR
ncbi:hypothetical protein ACH4S9_16280 [Streptomyces sp. NPDC021225]